MTEWLAQSRRCRSSGGYLGEERGKRLKRNGGMEAASAGAETEDRPVHLHGNHGSVADCGRDVRGCDPISGYSDGLPLHNPRVSCDLPGRPDHPTHKAMAFIKGDETIQV